MLIFEAVPPVGPILVPALMGLFALAAIMVAIGILKLIDAIARIFFGTISGKVGWIPYAGKLVEHSLHKVEQKISHILGSAELKLDGYASLTWHNMARLVHFMANEIANGASTAWHLAQQARAFVRNRDMHHALRSATAPLKARQAALRRGQHNLASEQAALHSSVAQGVYPRLRAGEVYDRTVVQPNIRTARAEAKAAEAQAIATYKWMVRHRTGLLAGAFTGAAAWALTRLGGGWIRCKNWRTIGKHVCRWPFALIEGLLGLGLAFAVVIDPVKTARLAAEVTDDMDALIRKIAD